MTFTFFFSDGLILSHKYSFHCDISHSNLNSFFDSHTYRPIHGFDSFRGLHEVWGGKGSTISRNYPIGRFDQQGVIPFDRLPSRMIVHQGMFSATVPRFVSGLNSSDRAQGLAFVHIDCDLYSSTFEALASMVCLLKRGTIISFDEAKGFLEWKRAGEWRAWIELTNMFGIEWEGIAHFKMRVAVRVLNSIARWHPSCVQVPPKMKSET